MKTKNGMLSFLKKDDAVCRLTLLAASAVALAIFIMGYYREENVNSRAANAAYGIASPAPSKCVRAGNCYSCHMIDRGAE